jgi:hypothetical protein
MGMSRASSRGMCFWLPNKVALCYRFEEALTVVV